MYEDDFVKLYELRQEISALKEVKASLENSLLPAPLVKKKKKEKGSTICINCGVWTFKGGKFCTDKCRSDYEEDKRLLFASRRSRCEICGYNKYISVLEMHHLNPSEKKYTPSGMAKSYLPLREVVEELDKCVPLCPNCHREVHLGVTKI